MSGTEDPPSPELVGLVKVREHCVFTWRALSTLGAKRVRVEREHCDACIASVQEIGYVVEREEKR